MPIVLPNEGLPTMLGWMLREDTSALPANTLILFSNDITPDQDTVYGDLTEAAFGGYSSVSIARGTWTAPVVDSDHGLTVYGSTPLTWICTSSPETIYGYAVVTPSSPIILWCERFASPIVLSTGGAIALVPRFTLTTEP